MDSAFSVTEAFLVTGAPHASAYYPRDFAWFYPDVLDPETIMDAQDAVRRVRLLEKSVRLCWRRFALTSSRRPSFPRDAAGISA